MNPYPTLAEIKEAITGNPPLHRLPEDSRSPSGLCRNSLEVVSNSVIYIRRLRR